MTFFRRERSQRHRAALPCTGLAVATGLVVFSAATPAVAGEETDRFDPSIEIMLAGFDDTNVDTGWQPSGSPVQLRLQVSAANTMTAYFPGDGVYDWDAETIGFAGDPNGGLFTFDVGVLVHAEVRFDVLGLTWGSDLLGPYDYLIDISENFSPYLLEGNPERPVVVSDATEFATVASVPIVPDILVASGNLDIDLSFDVAAELRGSQILAVDEADGAVVVTEDLAETLAPDPPDPLDPMAPLLVDGTLTANLNTVTTVIVYPHLVMEILGTDYDIGGIEVPVDLPPVDQDIEFPAQTMEFDRPEPPSGTGDSAGASDGGGIDGTGGTGDGGGARPHYLDDGCNCSTTGSNPLGRFALLGLIPLLAFRRRR